MLNIYSDTTAFGYRMLGALTNPSYYGNLNLTWENVDLSTSLAAGWVSDPLEDVPVINPRLITHGRESGAYDFGSMLGSTMFTPGMYTDSIHWNFDIGLANPFEGPNNQAYIAAMLNNTHWDFSVPSFSTGINFSGLSGLNLGINPSIGVNPNNNENSDYAKFERKAKLLEKISEDNKSKIEEIRKEIGTDYKKGITKLDELLKDADKSKVKTAVTELYKEEYNSKLGAAKEISNKWHDTITTKNKVVDTTGLTTDNVLDVLGTFITNDIYESEAAFKLLIEKNEKIVDVLLQKAESMKSSFKSEYWEKEIVPRINVVKQDKSKHDKVFGLFKELRHVQTYIEDRDAAKKYGVPSDITVDTKVAQEDFKAELGKYNRTLFGKKLNTAA